LADKTLYTEKSIESLSPLEFTRLRPQVYAGDCTYSTQLLVEILANAIDEFRLGHGSDIDVNINKDIVLVRDYGQGFLVNSTREDGKTVLEAAFSVLNTSGKYHDDGVYEGTSLGSFGIGSKITTFLSHWLRVTTYRDGQYEQLDFKEGVFDKRQVGKTINPHITGTEVSWQPSEQFFTHTEVDVPIITKLIQTLVCLCPGLTINLQVNGNTSHYHSEHGIDDLVDQGTNGKEIIKNRFSTHFEEGKNKLDLVLTYTSNHSLTIVPYVNTGLTESGPHIVQIKTLLTREFNKFFREKGYLKEKDENLSGDDIQEGMYLVFNVTAPNVAYDAQVKSRVTRLEMKPFTSALAENLQFWLQANEKEVKAIAEKALTARKAREAARKARDAVRDIKPKEKNTLKAKMALSDKFIDCTNKDPDKRTLIIVEGVSAAGAVIEARNPQTDAIYLLRGKIISPLKTDVSKILANQEMSDLVKVIGAGFDKTFDLSKMNFSKILIATDQDSDGEDIELMLTTFFFTYMRPLVLAGKLYRAVTPLYIVRRNGKEQYFYSEEEYQNWRKVDGKGDVTRAKGLGELNAPDLHAVCFEHERYKRLTVNDEKAVTALLETLMGSAIEPRKQYIYNNAERLGFNFV